MSLTLKKEKRQDLSKLNVFVEDTSVSSPNYFKLSDIPQILQKGKNLLRIKGNSQNLVEGSQVLIDVRDVNGNELYYQIPDFAEAGDKGRVISIWVYNDKGDDNTPNGDVTITIVGTAKFDLNGNPIPKKFQNTPNIRWSTNVTVDRDRDNTSPIIFNTTALPTVTVSESIETYSNIPQGSGLPTKTTTTGTDAKYLLKGKTPIVQITDPTAFPFNGEMVDGTLFLHSFTNPARPEPRIKNPTNITSYTSSIAEVLDNQTVRLTTPFTTTFDNRVGLTHRFSDIQDASFKIEHFSTGSNTVSNSKRAFANITISGSDPIVGVVDKVKVLIKSDGLDGDDELLNEVSVPFSSSYLVKIPIPSEHLGDVQKLKIQYLNSIGNISRTETISDAVAFQGNKDIVEGTLGGFAITPTAISSSFNLKDGTPALDLGISGSISGSSLFIRQVYEGTTYGLIDTVNSTIDAKNIGRQIVSDAEEYTRSNVDDDAAFTIINQYPVTFLPGETHLGIAFQARTNLGGSTSGTGTVRFSIATAQRSASAASTNVDYYDQWNTAVLDKDYAMSVIHAIGQVSSSISQGTNGGSNSIVEIPDSCKGNYCKIIVSLNQNITGGSWPVTARTRVKSISIVTFRQFAANITSGVISGSGLPDSIDAPAAGS
tara:strand:- start:1843 stop:3807 length:1965 start_codon:yes stop_codon:yes gene_type:complete